MQRAGLVLVAMTGGLLPLAWSGPAEAACSAERPFVFSWDPIRMPKPTNLCRFVKDEASAVRLGKAWFWDMQVGSDGMTACATCHFHAGVDNRVKNAISPHGSPETKEPSSFTVAPPNGTLTAASFPFHKLQDPENRKSTLLRDSDDIMSSQGVFRTRFNDIVLGQATEKTTVVPDPVFNVGGINVRQVEPRNTMSVFNVIFNHEQFWDGRAKFYFNGVNTSGLLDPQARILERQGTNIASSVSKVKVEIDMASVASQAVGPPTNGTEMSSAGRTFPKIGKKLLTLTPLAKQVVHPQDSVLGGLSKDTGALTAPGLNTTYRQMIEDAFQNKYWESNRRFNIAQVQVGIGAPRNTNEYTLMEMNTSLFWGLAIQSYLSTLISDDAPFDRYMSGDTGAMTAEEVAGKDLFISFCASCHKMPEVNKATIDHLFEFPTGIDRVIERMNMAKGGALERGAVYDGGFYNVGARPTLEDLGRGMTAAIVSGNTTINKPLSFSRNAIVNGEAVNKLTSPRLDPPLAPTEKVAVDGAFRVPSLRNVELSGPYYHTGHLATVRDVVMFYVRGGDFREQNIDLLDAGIGTDRFVQALKGRPNQQRALAKFMARPLTDERVRFERAPFDHPEIFVPDGHVGDTVTVTNDGKGQAKDIIRRVPPTGRLGGTTPLLPFLNLVPYDISG